MDVRGARLRKPSDETLSFTSSMAADERIARHVIQVNVAHMAALMKAGEVKPGAGSGCLKFLSSASYRIDHSHVAEDFHQQLEQDAIDALGVETAGYLNYGKSRNDQVAAAIRMELRAQIIVLMRSLLHLQGALLGLSQREGHTLFPGYTHLQHAQPVTLAHHLFAHFDAFQRDAERGFQLYPRVNESPMGSAAMAGTTVNIDRRYVASLLGFSGPVRNAMDGASSRDFAIEALSWATMVMLDASRLAEELILWSSSEFGFITLPDFYAASSSIMPQKKNAIVAELVRAKAGSVLGDFLSAAVILKALPFSYNLDLQELTPHLWSAFDNASSSLGLLAGIMGSVSINRSAVNAALANDNSTAVGLANYLVREHGLSFRQAHSVVGRLVRISVQDGRPLYEVASSRLSSVSARFGKKVIIDPATTRSILDSKGFLETIATEGGANPRFVAKGLKVRRRDLATTEYSVSELHSALKSSVKKLNATASGLAREVKSRD